VALGSKVVSLQALAPMVGLAGTLILAARPLAAR